MADGLIQSLRDDVRGTVMFQPTDLSVDTGIPLRGARTFDLIDPFGNTIFVMGPPTAASSAR